MPQSSVGFDLTPHDGVQSIRGGDVGHDREQYRADTEDKCALDFYSMSGGHDRPKIVNALGRRIDCYDLFRL